jgi:hypothetical protein
MIIPLRGMGGNGGSRVQISGWGEIDKWGIIIIAEVENDSELGESINRAGME